MKRPVSRRGSFTLLEVIVVLSIMLLLAGMLGPALNSMKEAARQSKCLSNMRQWSLAYRLYMNDHKGLLPHSYDDEFRHFHTYIAGTNATAYLQTNYLVYWSATPGYRIQGKLLCPTICRRNNVSDTAPHNQWGWCYNALLSDLPYEAGTGVYAGLGAYTNCDLDGVVAPANCAFIACGNGNSKNAGTDWDAFKSLFGEYALVKTHSQTLNVGFLDGHIQAFVAESDSNRVNQAWFKGIPIVGNPWGTTP